MSRVETTAARAGPRSRDTDGLALVALTALATDEGGGASRRVGIEAPASHRCRTEQGFSAQFSVMRWGRVGRGGFTLVELLTALTMIAILTAVAVNSGLSVTSSAKVKHGITDILTIQTRVDEFALTMDSLPTSLDAIGFGDLRDPWGNPYYYLPFKNGIEDARKDRFLVPVNTLYDLYSAGRDAKTTRSLSARFSQDDVVRANDGAFVGLGRAF